MESIYKKIKSIDELKKIVARLKKQDKKVVHCHGVFDLIHPGHIRHLAGAKKEGDVLVVTLTADKFVKRGPGRPFFNENLRAETLAALGHVDFVYKTYVLETPYYCSYTLINIRKSVEKLCLAKGILWYF